MKKAIWAAILMFAVPVVVWAAGKEDSAGRAVVTYEERLDGGTRTIPAPFPVRESGYPASTGSCLDVVCSTVGDGGLMGGGGALVTGGRYVSTVTTDSPIRVRGDGPCNSFTPGSGTGRIINEGTTLDFKAEASPDGGVPVYSCCAKTAGAIWSLCRQSQ